MDQILSLSVSGYNLFVNKEEVRLFQERWRAVHEFEIQERRAASPTKRLDQASAIYRMALGLGLVAKAKQTRDGYQLNWTRIKDILDHS